MNRTKQWIRNPKTLFFLLLILLAAGISSCKQEEGHFRDGYKKYFDGTETVFNAQDSVDVIKYNQRLFDLYSGIDEFYYNGITPYNLIYDMKHYDTTMLFKVLELYAKDSVRYWKDIGIPLYLAVEILGNDAVIKGTVVEKIIDHKECRFFETTYLIKVDSILHAYFEIKVGDTVKIPFSSFGVNGYCDSIARLGYSKLFGVKDYKVGERNLYFFLDRSNYVRSFFQTINRSTKNYNDPFCIHSFVRNMRNEHLMEEINKSKKSSIKVFIKKIK